jgi:hypothetical protein
VLTLSLFFIFVSYLSKIEFFLSVSINRSEILVDLATELG